MPPRLIESLVEAAKQDSPLGDVRLIQTHISWVILAGESAYKIKKSVRFGFLDYSTLELRKDACEREWALNRRTCPDAYLGVVPITVNGGVFRIGGDGDAVEYAVHMRRLPAEGWLSNRIERGDVSADVVRRIARTLHAFHAGAATDTRIARFGSKSETSAIWHENLKELQEFAGDAIPAAQFDAIAAFGEQFLSFAGTLIDQRASDGRVRDCHGDLRSDSIHIGERGSICITDCIEFSDRLRCSDVAGDLGFLAMDLDFRGHRELADECCSEYVRSAWDDETLPYMLPFFRCYRALVRAKVESIAAEEQEVAPRERALAAERSARYVELAHEYASESVPLALVVVAGFSGSGKSYLAAALAARIGAVLIRTDSVRRQPHNNHDSDRAPDYGDEERGEVYRRARGRARMHLLAGRTVVLDATHVERRERDAARELADEFRAPELLVWVNVDPDVAHARLAARDTAVDDGDVSDARWHTYLAQVERLEPGGADEQTDWIEVDGSVGATSNITRITKRLRLI